MKGFTSKLIPTSILAFGLFPILPSEKRGVLVVLLGLSALLFLWSFKQLRWRKEVLINSSLYLMYALSLLYSFEGDATIRRFETALSLLLIPVFFLILSATKTPIFKKEIQLQFYKLFYFSAIILSLVLFIYIGTLGFYSNFDNYEFCMSQIDRKLPWLNDHPIYISISLSIAILFSVVLMKQLKAQGKNIYPYLLGSGFLAFTLFFLSRKGLIVALMISVVVLVITLFKTNKKTIIYSLLIVFLAGVMAFLLPSNKKRFKELFDPQTYTTRNETNSTNNRIQIYKCAVELIKEKPLFGHGVGKDRVALNTCYKENLYYLFENNFNTHSQYLSVATKIGLVGLFIFVLCLGYYVKLAITKKDWLFLSILSLYLLVFLFENVLERQNGVILFAFLLNYFVFKHLYYTSDNDKISH